MNSCCADRFRRSFAVVAAVAWLAGLAACAGGGREPAAVVAAVVLDTPLIDESSGLARSQRRDDLLWTLNDSGGATELYAIGTDGRLRARLRVTGAPANVDWEDLASYRHNGAPYLLIGGSEGRPAPLARLRPGA